MLWLIKQQWQYLLHYLEILVVIQMYIDVNSNDPNGSEAEIKKVLNLKQLNHRTQGPFR